MFTTKKLVLFGALLLIAAIIAACGTPGPQGEPGPQGPQGDPGPAPAATDFSCTECHDAAGTISAKRAGWELSKHGSGTAMAEEYNRNSCTFCHSGNSFSQAIAEGKNFTQLEVGATEPARQDCRSCHQIHETYTTDDWALETTDPVAMVVSGATFDGGDGNLCVNCHQARRYLANFVAKDKDGNVIPDTYQTNVRFNTHLSDQSDVMLGVLDVNDILGVEGKEAAHYSKVADTCVGCHLGPNRNHTFEPSYCEECHSEAEKLTAYETEFEAKMEELHEALTAKGLFDASGAPVTKNADGSPLLMDPKTAAAMFVYGALEEDASNGAHNPAYASALLDAAIEALK